MLSLLDVLVGFSSSLLFSLFPLHFENVSWISGRTDLLSFLFASLSVLFFIYFLKKTGNRHGLITLSALCYLLSLLSKENTLFLPLVFFIIIYRREPVWKRAVPPMIPFGLSLVIWFILRRVALSSVLFQASGRSVLDFFSSIGFYSFKTMWSFGLNFTIDSGRVFGNPFYIGFGILLVGLFLSALVLLFKKNFVLERGGILIVSFFLALLPSVLVIFSASTVSFLAWRFLYLPSAFFILFVVFQARSHIKWKGVLAGLLLLVCLAYSAEIYPKNGSFGQRAEDFWVNMRDVEDENFLAQFNVALFTLPHDEERAVDLFNRILNREDHHLHERFKIRIYEELAAYFTFNGMLDRAEGYFNRLMQARRVQSQHFYVTYASFLALSDRAGEGEKLIQQMLGLFPENHLILLHSAKFYILIKDYDRALDLLKKDYTLFPTDEIKALLEQVESIKNRR